jgi:hypothetical protein
MTSGAVIALSPRVGRQRRRQPPSDKAMMTTGGVGLDLGPTGLDLG